MTRPAIPFYRPSFPAAVRGRITADIEAILAGGTLMMGPYKDRLERGFAELCGTRHAVSVNSCTTAILISLMHFKAAGGEVLVPAGSFVTDVGAVMMAGATPVLVDIDPETLALDLDDLARKLTPRTRGIIWVHLAGVIASNWREIRRFATDNGLFLIEDAAHAHGAEIDGHTAGSLGDVGVFSFYPTKVVTGGTGGMLTTDDEALKLFAERVRMFGKDPASGDIVELGNDWFLDEIRACVTWHHLQDLPRQLAHRRALAARYDAALANQPGIRVLPLPENCRPSFYHYVTLLDPSVDYDAIAGTLQQRHGIATKRIYRPLHHEPLFRHLDDGRLRMTESTLSRSLCLPMFADMPLDDADRVAAALIEALRARQ
ncbi:MAG: DegT/DnrJ/EryC1/StrS family aminotransferase [Alphaproteobacteria bacterium]